VKTKILKLSAIILLLSLMGAGCEKERIDYDPGSIIGKWKWLYTIGGIVGTTYPKKGDTVIWEFTEDSLLVRALNGETIFEVDVRVSGDTLKYFESSELTETMYRYEIKGDTLSLFPLLMGPFSHIYKRVN